MEIVGPACAACLMVALTHAPLGLEVLRRGIIFIDLAIAQIAGLGVIVVTVWGGEVPSWWLVQAGAVSFALFAAFTFRWVERRLPEQQEAIIGCSFVVAASLSLLLLANRPHGGEEIEHLLSGQVLFVTWRDASVHLPVYASILALWFGCGSWLRQSAWFYVLFAVAITSSVQLVGVYVVFASLILPALAATSSKQPQRTAWACGICAVLSGIACAACFDLPAGPVIVLSYATVSLLMARYSWLATSGIRLEDDV